MPDVLRSADLHLVSLRPDPLFEITIPSKIQTLLLAGVPIVVAVAGEPARIIERSGAGFTAAAGDSLALAAAIQQAAALPNEELLRAGRNGREYYMRNMSRSVGTSRLLDAVETAMEARRHDVS